MSKSNKAQKAQAPAPEVAATVETAPVEAGVAKEEGLEQSVGTDSLPENTPSSDEGVSVTSLAAEGLRDGSALTDDEVQRVSGAVLAGSDEEDKPDPVNVEAVVAVLSQRVAEMEVLIFKLERKVADLEDKLYGVAKDAKLRVKDGESLHGKVDDLRI